MFKRRLFQAPVVQLIFLLVFCVGVSRCTEKHEPSIKNMTDIDKTKPKPKMDDPFKKDLRKYQRECGADISGEDDDDDDDEASAEEIPLPKGQRPKDNAPNAHWAYEKKRGGKGGTYPSQYGKKKGSRRGSDEDSDEDEDEDDYRGSSNRRKGGNNRRGGNRKGNKKGRPSDDYDDSRGSDNCDDESGKRGGGGRKGFNSGQWGSMGGGMGYNRGGGGGRYNTKNYAYPTSWSDPYGQKTEYGVVYSSSPDIWGSRTGFSTYGGRLMAMNGLRRAKRQKNDGQCMSQCVFGYLEMLDDNRVPAETEVIKYFQRKIQNASEKTKLIQMARKCFAKLSTAEIAENEDGCQFSKDLAKCLQLQIKGETL